MAEVHFRINGTTYHLSHENNSNPSQERLGFKGHRFGAISVPAMSTQGLAVYSGGKGSHNTKMYYDTSSPTIAFRKNGTTYYCSKETKFAGETAGRIVSTSVSVFHLSSNYYERDITVNFSLSKTLSSSGVPSPKYELRYTVAANEGLAYNIYKSGDSWSGTTYNASYSSVLEIVAVGGNPAARLIISFELWDALNENLIASKDVRVDGPWYNNSPSGGGGGGSGGE